MKNYCILATDNKGNWLGYVEESFQMSWDSERVRCFPAGKSKDCSKPSRQFWKEKKSRFHKNDEFSNPELKGKIGYMRKLILAKHVCGRTEAEYTWNYWKNELKSINPPYNGWEVKIFRANSKYCPVRIDFTERINEKKLQLKKYDWRNPRFFVVGQESGESTE